VANGAEYYFPNYECQLLQMKNLVRKGGFHIPGRPKSKEINAKFQKPHQHWLLAPLYWVYPFS
jgi:hypothetical protein